MGRSVCFDLAASTSIRAGSHTLYPLSALFRPTVNPSVVLLRQNSAIMMSSSSTSNNQLSSTPSASPPSRVVVSENPSPDDTASTSKDIQQALLLPTCLPPNLRRLLITIQHLLRTNDAPSSQDSVIISECVSLIDDHVAELDATMALASTATPHISTAPLRMPSKQSASIEEQNTQPADLQHLREQVQSVNSPIRLVPQEIWQLIFVAARSDWQWVTVFDGQDPAYIVGQVCQKWRRASIRCPQLWSQLVIPAYPSLALLPCVSHLRTVLERSCTIPLTFFFKGRGDVEPEVPTQLLSVLMEYSSRWRSAEFVGMTFAQALLLGNVRGRIPHLQAMSINLCLEDVGDERRDVVSAFEIAPELSHVGVVQNSSGPRAVGQAEPPASASQECP
ncbi:hypothetical protein BDZ89DRAFT_474740 [Hymenopellis radicata]|nr:hypothetical protein BDZ89DRAFT_474740 [Hymenopellis radicata]